MAALNEEYFDQPEALFEARGDSRPRRKIIDEVARTYEWTDWTAGEGGIVSPRRYPIAAGITLVRFGGFGDGAAKDRTREQIEDPFKRDRKERASGPLYFGAMVALGAWWLEWSAYKAIEQYADRIGESVAYAVREVCAVPPEWSDLSFVIQGTTRSPLLAYAGIGRVVNARSGKIDPSAHGKPLIDQLFIPGLSYPDLNKKAIIVHSHGPLDPEMSVKGARQNAESTAAMHMRLKAGVTRR